MNGKLGINFLWMSENTKSNHALLVGELSLVSVTVLCDCALTSTNERRANESPIQTPFGQKKKLSLVMKRDERVII